MELLRFPVLVTAIYLCITTTVQSILRYPCLVDNVCECSEGTYDPPYKGVVTIDCRGRNLTRIPLLVDLHESKYYRFWLRDNDIDVVETRSFRHSTFIDIDLGGHNPLRYVADKALVYTEHFLKHLTLNVSLLNIYKLRFLHYVPKLLGLTLEGDDSKDNVLHSRLFPGYKMKAMKKLTLMHCGIMKIEYDAFMGVSNVEELHLSHNRLVTVPSNSLIGLRHLTKLDISFNQLDNLHDKSFGKMYKLSDLDLTGNNFQDPQAIDKDVFLDQKKILQKLVLSNTFLSAVPTHAIRNLEVLSHLNVSYNLINNIDNNTETFSGFKLKELDLSGNSIPLRKNLLNGLENTLTKLTLRNMNLTSLPWKLLLDLTRLYQLDISDNILLKIPDNFNQGLSIRHFVLRRMGIREISAKAFIKPSEIAELTVDIESNWITSVAFITQTKPCTFHEINLMWNPVNCDCALYKVVMDGTFHIRGTCNGGSKHFVNVSFSDSHLRGTLRQLCPQESPATPCGGQDEQKEFWSSQASVSHPHTSALLSLMAAVVFCHQYLS